MVRRRGATVSILVVLAGCTTHPVGPARSFAAYEGKAVTTAEAALSAVETIRLTVRTAAAGHGFGPYLSVTASDQEEELAGVQSTFESLQPPDGRADALRDALDQLTGDALDHAAAARIALRRGNPAGVAASAGPLSGDAAGLRRFIEDHRS